MSTRLTGRAFVAATGISALISPSLLARAQGPQILAKTGSKPVVVSAANGNTSKDANGLTCVAKAGKEIARCTSLPGFVPGDGALRQQGDEARGVLLIDASIHGQAFLAVPPPEAGIASVELLWLQARTAEDSQAGAAESRSLDESKD